MHAPTEARYFYDLVVRLIPVDGPERRALGEPGLTMLWLVAGGRGIAFVPQSAALLGIAGVEFVSLVGLPPHPVELHLLWLREARNPALRAILEALRQADF